MKDNEELMRSLARQQAECDQIWESALRLVEQLSPGCLGAGKIRAGDVNEFGFDLGKLQAAFPDSVIVVMAMSALAHLWLMKNRNSVLELEELL